MGAVLMAGARHGAGRNRRFWLVLASLLAAGAIVRLILLAITPGEYYDTSAIAKVGQLFLHHPLHVYQLDVNPGTYQGSPTYTWPYLSGFLPVAAALRWLSLHLGPSVNHLDRLLMIGVDLAMAWLVQWILGRWGRPARARLLGAALVALGPTFIAVSAVHGQIDAAAWLPAVAAVGLWQAPEVRRRAVLCGGLIGIGIAVKTTPGLVLLALAPTARDRREIAALVLTAATIAVVSVLPFALAAHHGLAAVFGYRGFAGRAGLTVLLQPTLALHELSAAAIPYNATTTFLLDHAGLLLVIVLVPVAAVVWIQRMPAARGAVALLLAFYLAGAAILPQYWLWIVPFLVLAGFYRAALLYQLAMSPLLVATYAFLQEPHQPLRQLSRGLILYGYVPWLWIVTCGLLGGLMAMLNASRPSPLSAS